MVSQFLGAASNKLGKGCFNPAQKCPDFPGPQPRVSRAQWFWREQQAQHYGWGWVLFYCHSWHWNKITWDNVEQQKLSLPCGKVSPLPSIKHCGTPCRTVQNLSVKAWENKKPRCPCKCALLCPAQSLGCFAHAQKGKGPGRASEPSLCRYFLIALIVNSVTLQYCWCGKAWPGSEPLESSRKIWVRLEKPLVWIHFSTDTNSMEEMRPKLEVTGAEVCRFPNPPLGFLPWRSLCVPRKWKSPWEVIVCCHGGWVSSSLDFSSFPLEMLEKNNLTTKDKQGKKQTKKFPLQIFIWWHVQD